MLQTSKASPKLLHLVQPHSGSLAPLFLHHQSRGEAEPWESCLRHLLSHFTAGQMDTACQRSISCFFILTVTLLLC